MIETEKSRPYRIDVAMTQRRGFRRSPSYINVLPRLLCQGLSRLRQPYILVCCHESWSVYPIPSTSQVSLCFWVGPNILIISDRHGLRSSITTTPPHVVIPPGTQIIRFESDANQSARTRRPVDSHRTCPRNSLALFYEDSC